MLSEHFQYLVEQYGKPDQAIPLEADALASYRGKLPPSLLDFWQECGVGMWLDGKFQFCDPAKYRSIVQIVLAGDAQFTPEETHVYGYTAFGELWLWNEKWQRLEITLPRLWASASATKEGWSQANPDIAIAPPFARLDRATTANWREDAEGAPLMFTRVLEALGPLALGEVYGFFPALELGGKATVANTRKVKALEHFALLAQLGPVQLFDYTSGRQTSVRTLGAGG